MGVFKKILLLWIAALAVGATCLTFLPNDKPTMASMVLDSSSVLIGIVCLFIFLKEPGKSNRPIFLNFSLFFLACSLFAFVYKFVGDGNTVFSTTVRYYFYQYHIMFQYFLLSFSVLYVVIDSFFNEIRTSSKYLVTLLLVGGTFAYYYYPYIENPGYLGTTEEWKNYSVVNSSVEKLASQGNASPTVKEIATLAQLGVWRGGIRIGILTDEQKLNCVSQLLPYLAESNYQVLMLRPLFLNNIYMNVLCVVFIFVFFGYQYKNDPPQGAYIEKIIFLFLPYCSLEILHHYAYIKSVEYSTFEDVQQIGIYLTLVNMALLLVFFSLRLRFITSVKGEFYERELVSDAEHISRWRDAFDNLVVRHFLNPKEVHGRLFAPRSPRGEA
jgi:hypothetical protein